MSEVDRLYPLISPSDLVKYAKLFKYELIAALHNQSSSLPAILNPVAKISPNPGFGIAVSVGGTNGYVSAFRISKNGTVKFLNRRLFSLPPQTTRDNLFHLITKHILEINKSKTKSFPIGIGLAYPLKPLLHCGFIDGELLYMTKGRNIEGLVGKKVGQEYHKFLIKEYGIDTTVVVANDAICLLAGGDGVSVAGVVGTGLNFAYWEKREKIAPLKLGQLCNFVQGDIAINIESKNFDKIEETTLRNIIDKESDDPGYSLSEKEVSGAYLYKIFNAGKDKLLDKSFPELSSTDQLNDILTNAFKYKQKITNDKIAKKFAERIFHRSAQIVAIQLCGILSKIGKTEGAVSIVMDGGIFWKAHNYPALVNLYVNMIFPSVIPSYARLFGSSRRGIAILANSIIS